MVAFYNFPLSTFPDFGEITLRKLTKEEVGKYQKEAEVCSIFDTDVKKLKEWLVVDLNGWFLVRWA